jgi:hypothetical protein
MTAPTYTQQQTPHLFGQVPGYDPFNPYGTSFQGGFAGLGQQAGQGQPWTQQPWGQQQLTQQPWGQQQWGQQQWGQQQGQSDIYTLVWQLLGYAQQSIQLAQQIVLHSLQQQTQYPMMTHNQLPIPFGPRGFQRQPMAW